MQYRTCFSVCPFVLGYSLMPSTSSNNKHRRQLKRQAKAKRLRISKQDAATKAARYASALEKVKLQLWKQTMLNSLESPKTKIVLEDD
jgi:hypothetical protein